MQRQEIFNDYFALGHSIAALQRDFLVHRFEIDILAQSPFTRSPAAEVSFFLNEP